VLTTLVKADGGTVRVAGHDIATQAKAVRAAVGVTGQFAAVDELLTGQENLQLMADLKHVGAREGRQVVTELLERFDLAEPAQKLVSTYSGGMRRKLDLAMTLVGNPRIIFLDEPTAGLDPRSRRTMWEIVRDLVADGVTVFLTTSTSRKPISSPTGSRYSTRAAWLPRALPATSNARSPAVMSGSGSPTSSNSARRRRSWPAPHGTTRN
jgi:ABC-type multidrug transport system ATPase subunit